MMNWRMLGFHIGRMTLPVVGTIVIVLGSILTLLICAPLFLNQNSQRKAIPWISLFGIFSATLAITWHSHQHMALILVPFFLHFLQESSIPAKLFKAWVFVPFFTYVAAILIGILIFLHLFPMVDGYGGLMTGTCMLLFNLFFVYRAMKMKQGKPSLAQAN